MTDDTRGAIADLAILGVAGVAVYIVATRPPLRRMAWRLVKYALFTAAPTYLWQETTRAWSESANLEHHTRNPAPEYEPGIRTRTPEVRTANPELRTANAERRMANSEQRTRNREPGTGNVGKPAIIDA
jgi:hypothetical protein